MSVGDQRPEGSIAERAKTYYDAHLKEQLEREHFGKVIALEADSGEYVLGDHYVEVCREFDERFRGKPIYCFRVGGGGAVKFGGRVRRVRPA